MSDSTHGATSLDQIRTNEPKSLVDRVYQQLHSRITSGEFDNDVRLPSEHEIARAADVSRPVVRDALGRLRAEGLIFSKRGAGSFVRQQAVPTTQVGFAPMETVADIQRCYEFRINTEPHAASLAALRRDNPSLEKIASALGVLSDATARHSHREDADFAFHLAISEASNNHYYAATMKALKDHINTGMHFHGLTLLGPTPHLEVVLAEHRLIYETIAAGDAAAAERAMHSHLIGSRDRLFEGRLLDLRF